MHRERPQDDGSSAGGKLASGPSDALFVGRYEARRPATFIWGLGALCVAVGIGSMAIRQLMLHPDRVLAELGGFSFGLTVVFTAAVLGHSKLRAWITHDVRVLVVSTEGVSRTLRGRTEHWSWPEILSIEFQPSRWSAISRVFVRLNRPWFFQRIRPLGLTDTFTPQERDEILSRIRRHCRDAGLSTRIVGNEPHSPAWSSRSAPTDPKADASMNCESESQSRESSSSSEPTTDGLKLFQSAMSQSPRWSTSLAPADPKKDVSMNCESPVCQDDAGGVMIDPRGRAPSK